MSRLATLFRSALVGGVATAVDLGVLSLLVSALGVPARIASVPALLLGIVVQFVGNKVVAFRDPSKAWARQAGLFFGVEVLGFISNLLIFDRLVAWTPIPYLFCRMLSTSLVYLGLCLPLWARIFDRRAAGADSGARGALGTQDRC